MNSVIEWFISLLRSLYADSRSRAFDYDDVLTEFFAKNGFSLSLRLLQRSIMRQYWECCSDKKLFDLDYVDYVLPMSEYRNRLHIFVDQMNNRVTILGMDIFLPSKSRILSEDCGTRWQHFWRSTFVSTEGSVDIHQLATLQLTFHHIPFSSCTFTSTVFWGGSRHQNFTF